MLPSQKHLLLAHDSFIVRKLYMHKSNLTSFRSRRRLQINVVTQVKCATYTIMMKNDRDLAILCSLNFLPSRSLYQFSSLSLNKQQLLWGIILKSRFLLNMCNHIYCKSLMAATDDALPL